MLVVEDESDGPLANLGRVSGWFAHGSKFSRFGASDKPGAVQAVASGGAGGLLWEPPYKFEYDNPAALPELSSTLIDHWGFYNAESNGKLLPSVYYYSYALGGRMIGEGAQLEPSSSLSQKRGSLTSITFPTGGKLVVAYEANDFSSDGNGVESGFQVPQSAFVRSAPDDPTYSPTVSQPVQVVKEVNEPLGEPILQVKVTLKPTCWNGVGNGSCDRYVTITGPQGQVALYAAQGNLETVTYALQVPPGAYTVTAHSAASPSTFEAQAEVTWTNYYLNPPPNTPPQSRMAGGLRVASTTLYPQDGSPSIVRRYEYVLESDGVTSSGVLNNYPRYVNEYGTDHLLPTQFVPHERIALSVSSTPSIPLGTTQGGIVGYSRVEEHVNDELHKVHYFITPLDYPDVYSNLPLSPWSAKPETSLDWKRGAERKTDYMINGSLTRSEKHEYDMVHTNSAYEEYMPALSYKYVIVPALDDHIPIKGTSFGWYKILGGFFSVLSSTTTTR